MDALTAGFWSFVGGASLLIGALIGLYVGVPQRVIAIIAAAGAGVLVSSVAGYLFLAGAPEELIAAILAFAAGAILTMLASTMFPEAYEEGGHVVGVVTTIGRS